MYGPALRFDYLTDGMHARRQFAAGQLDQGFPWFFSVLEQMLSQYPKSTLHWMLFMQPSPKLTSEFSAKCHVPNSIKTSSFCCFTNTKSAQMPHFSAAYCQQSTSHHLTLFTSQRFSLLPAYLYQKDGRALPGNLQCAKHSWFPSVTVVPTLSPAFSSLSLSFLLLFQNVHCDANCMWQGQCVMYFRNHVTCSCAPTSASNDTQYPKDLISKWGTKKCAILRLGKGQLEVAA